METIEPHDGSDRFLLKGTLNMHKSDVCTLSILPNGRLASAGGDKQIQISNPETGEQVTSLKGHSSTVLCSAVSTNGYLITGSADRVVRLWDVEKGVTVLKLSLNDYVRCLCVLSNGDVAAGCEDSTIALFSEKDFALKKPLKAHTMSVNTMTILEHNGLLVSGSTDKTIKVWNTKTGVLLSDNIKHKNWVRAVDTVPNSNFIVSSSFDKSIAVWEPMKSTCEYTIDTPTLACGFCKLDSKDDEFAYACGKSISILSAKHPFEVKSSLAGHTRTIWCLKKLPNGDLVSGSADRTIKIWSKNCEN